MAKKITKPETTATLEPERHISAGERAWEEKTLNPTLKKSPERAEEFTTVSGYPIRRLYTQADLPDWNPETALGYPGEPPYTRGIHPTMYRGRLWTMRQFAGFGTAEDTNAALPLLARTRPDRPFRSFRSAYPDGLRLGPSTLRRRSRKMRRRHQLPRRYGSSLRPNSHRRTSPPP